MSSEGLQTLLSMPVGGKFSQEKVTLRDKIAFLKSRGLSDDDIAEISDEAIDLADRRQLEVFLSFYRDLPFIQMLGADPKVTKGAQRVAFLLISEKHFDANLNATDMSLSELSRRTGYSRPTILKIVKLLEKEKYFTIKRPDAPHPQETNRYSPNWKLGQIFKNIQEAA